MAIKKRKQQSFEYGAIILLCSTMLVKLIGAIFKIPLSNLIGDLGFGYFSSAYDLFTPIYSLSMAGLPIAVSRLVAEQMAAGKYREVRRTLSVTKKAFFVTGFIGLALMLLLIYPFVKLTDPTGKTVYSLFAIAPALLFCCVMSTYRGYYEGLRNMYPTAASDVIEAMGKLVLGLGFAYVVMLYTKNVAFAAAGAMLGITVGAALAALYLRLRYKFKGDLITKEEMAESPEPSKSREILKALFAIAVPVVLASLANNIASLVDVSMVKWQLARLMENSGEIIKNMYSSSISDYNLTALEPLTSDAVPTFLYGIRGKAFTLYNLVPTITSVLGVSALPVLASSWFKGDKLLVKRNIDSMIKLTAFIAMPAGIGFLAIGGNIMGLLYNTVASVQIGGTMLRIFGAAAFFAGLAIPMTSMLQAVNHQVAALRNVAIGAALKIVVNFIFVGIPTVNIQGAATGTLACYLFIFIANLITLVKVTGVKPSFKKVLLKPLIASAMCGVAAYAVALLGTSRIITIASVAAAALVYLVSLVAVNAFEKEDVLALPKGEKLLEWCLKLKIIR